MIGDGGAGAAPEKLSAIEAVFQRHMQSSLSGFSSILAEIDSKFQRRKEVIITQYATKVEGIRAGQRVATKLGR